MHHGSHRGQWCRVKLCVQCVCVCVCDMVETSLSSDFCLLSPLAATTSTTPRGDAPTQLPSVLELPA